MDNTTTEKELEQAWRRLDALARLIDTAPTSRTAARLEKEARRYSNFLYVELYELD